MKNPHGTNGEANRFLIWECVAIHGYLREHFGEPPLTKEEREYIRKRYEQKEQPK